MIRIILSALFTFVAMISLITNCRAEAPTESIKTFYVEIPFNYELNKSSVIGAESPKGGNCNEKGKKHFDTQSSDILNKTNDKLVIIKSWKELKEIKKELKSQTLQKIKQSDFSEFDYAITLVTYGDYSYLQNEKLIRNKNKLLFSYDLRSVPAGPGPVSSCIDMKLYIIKLRK